MPKLKAAPRRKTDMRDLEQLYLIESNLAWLREQRDELVRELQENLGPRLMERRLAKFTPPKKPVHKRG